jgi:hypothetical protein
MSLAVLNEGKPVPEQHKAAMAQVLAAHPSARGRGAEHGDDAVGRLYTAIGRRVHDDKRQVDDQLLTEALQDSGLPQQLLAAADDTALDAAVRDSHRQGRRAWGPRAEAPSPPSAAARRSSGPVVSPAPDRHRGPGPVGRDGRDRPGPGAERAQAGPAAVVTPVAPRTCASSTAAGSCARAGGGGAAVRARTLRRLGGLGSVPAGARAAHPGHGRAHAARERGPAALVRRPASARPGWGTLPQRELEHRVLLSQSLLS